MIGSSTLLRQESKRKHHATHHQNSNKNRLSDGIDPTNQIAGYLAVVSATSMFFSLGAAGTSEAFRQSEGGSPSATP